jgi:outer membrane protein TolC
VTADLQQRLDEALDLARRAQRERALACSDLTEAKGAIGELRSDLRDARLSLAAARELLAYHGLTPVDSGGE